MSATHDTTPWDTYNWPDAATAAHLAQRQDEARRRAEAMEEEQANRRAWNEWRRNMNDR
jgi:hypothetical protein